MLAPALQLQRLDAKSLHYVLNLFKRRVLFAALNAGIVVGVEVGGSGHGGLGHAGIFAGIPKLFAQFFASICLIFTSHIWITIPSQTQIQELEQCCWGRRLVYIRRDPIAQSAQSSV